MAALVQYPIIQNKVDELLATEAIDPSIGSTGLYSYVFDT